MGHSCSVCSKKNHQPINDHLKYVDREVRVEVVKYVDREVPVEVVKYVERENKEEKKDAEKENDQSNNI